MVTSTDETAQVRKRAADFLARTGIVITDDEKAAIEVVHFGLDMLETIGLQIVVYVNTDRCCAKELIMFPGQTCPEHQHPPFGGTAGKEETFRCRWGEVYLYVPGYPAAEPKGRAPDERKSYFTVWHEIILGTGEQYTLPPDTLHWFQAGPEGAIVSEFSTQSRDDLDVFTDPDIRRVP